MHPGSITQSLSTTISVSRNAHQTNLVLSKRKQTKVNPKHSACNPNPLALYPSKITWHSIHLKIIINTYSGIVLAQPPPSSSPSPPHSYTYIIICLNTRYERQADNTTTPTPQPTLSLHVSSAGLIVFIVISVWSERRGEVGGGEGRDIVQTFSIWSGMLPSPRPYQFFLRLRLDMRL